MGFGDIGSSLGSAFGKAVSRTVPRKSSGRSFGRSVTKTVNPRSKYRRSSSGSGSSSRRSTGGTNSGGGGSSRRNNNSGGGGGGVKRIQPIRPVAPKVSLPSLGAYLGTDAAYQNIVRGGKRSLADFLSEIGRRRGEATTQFNQTKSSMERDRTQQLDSLRQEFASRGLINSGLFAEEQGRFQQQFTEQGNALGQQQAALLADLLSQQKNFQREQQLALEAAKQDAIARRAAKYKIGA